MDVTAQLDHSTATKRRGRCRTLIGTAALLAGVGVAYWPSLRNGYVWDDDDYVYNEPAVVSPDGFWRVWIPTETVQYYPLVFTMFWLQARLWGVDQPAGFHAVNMLFHALTALLLWRLLLRLELPGAWLAAAVFAVHPVQVESVAWITELKNTLSGVFYFASFLCFLNYEDARRPRSYAASMALFVCALLSKSVTATLPLAILIVRWFRRKPIDRRYLMSLAPMLAIGAALAGLTVWIEKTHVGASGPIWSVTFAEKIVLAGRALWFYFGKIVWPDPITFIYPRWELDATTFEQWLWPIAALAAALLAWVLRFRIGRGPLAAMLFFAVTLGPALGFLQAYWMRYSFVADHFQYLACAGPIVLMVAAITRLSRRVGSRMGPIFAAGVLVALGALTWRQCLAYADEETLWRDTIAKNPGATVAYYNLGGIQKAAGRLDEAAASYEAVLSIDPDDTEARNVLGTLLADLGRTDEARDAYERVLQIDPDDAIAHNNLGLLDENAGRLDEAEARYRRAVELDARLAAPHYNIGNLMLKRGRADEAMREFRTAVTLRPGYADAHAALGEMLQRDGKIEEALAQLEAAFGAAPTNAVHAYNLATLEARMNRTREAIDHLRAALRLRPEYAPAALNLSTLHRRSGLWHDAVQVLKDARAAGAADLRVSERLAWILATAPDDAVRNGAEAVTIAERVCSESKRQDPAALDTLAAAYAEVGRFDEAVATATEAASLAASKAPERVKGIEGRISEYRLGRPHREGEQADH